MAIISSVGRRHIKIRLILGAVYFLLTVGAVTMVYPFLLMVGGSTKSAVDVAESRVVPLYLTDDVALYRKYVEGQMNESTEVFRNTYGLADGMTFAKIVPPESISPLVKEWREFLASYHPRDATEFILGFFQCPLSRNAAPYNLREFRSAAMREAKGGINAFNAKYNTSFASISMLVVTAPNYVNSYVIRPDSDYLRLVERFCVEQPQKWRNYVSLGNLYHNFLQLKYGKPIALYNRRHKTKYAAWKDVPFWENIGAAAPEAREDEEDFARNYVNPVWLRLVPEAAPAYRAYLAKKYENQIAMLNGRYHTAYASFDEVPMSDRLPESGISTADWRGFISGWPDGAGGPPLAAPAEMMRIEGPDSAFHDFLRKKYGSVAAMDQSLGLTYASWEVVPMPQRDAQYQDFLGMRSWLRWEFTTRNFREVWSYLVSNGRAMFNTLVFCSLAVLAALTVDPIAAYALSRFKPNATYKILLFFMMTMAFPTMVTQIPMFLLLRHLGLLNTFGALVLPGLANGYHIFLLKGFFDSLPKELYESAEIDGAGELRIFLQITMSLSKPILAVIALGAFTASYTAFMFALLLCQDPKMWTLMVWLYQLQQHSSEGIIFSSLIIAAIPTFIIFVTCQKVIMRGIVVPVEK